MFRRIGFLLFCAVTLTALFADCQEMPVPQTPGEPFSSEQAVLRELFDAYIARDREKIKNLVIEKSRGDIDEFIETLDVLPADKPVQGRRYFFLPESRVYKDRYMHSDFKDSMADTAVCLVIVSAERTYFFYIFYHFHFNEEGTRLLYLGFPYIKESRCAPQ